MSSLAYLEVNPEQCLRLRHKKSSCRLCLENCPTGAISFDESLEIDNSLCHGCGICANLCPTGVFGLKDLSYELLLAEVRRGGVVEFTCSLLPQGKDGLRVPCLGYLNEAALIGAIGCGGQAVRLNVTQCRKCDFASGLRVAVKSLRRANRTLALFGIPRKISASAKELGGGYSRGESELYSRREFFSYLKRETRSTVASVIDSTISDREVPTKTRVTLEPRLPKKRSLLLGHIKQMGQPITEWAKADGLPFAQVEIGDGCNGCGMCVTFCPTGALRSYDQGDRQVIDFSSGYCLACSLCSDICPEGAIAYSPHINPYDLITNSRKIMIEHRRSACPECGQSYVVVSGSSLCLNCRKKKGLEEWLARIWQHSQRELS